jgi:single-stranded-DNA-specific exonuclease
MSFGTAGCKWLLSKTNLEYIDYISRITGFSSPVAQVLINRGIKTSRQIDSFLNPDLTRLADPFELPGMGNAVKRIATAARQREKVLIHGDYDADGITATVIMMEALKKLGIEARYYIPDRALGYGLGAEGIKRARETGVSLIVTVDCGINSFEAVSTANSLGIDVIITDHHEPFTETSSSPEKQLYLLPDAVAIINPKLIPPKPVLEEAPLAELSGAGVAFKLAQALLGNNIDNVRDLLDLAALGTAADVVPVVGDNRIILKEGLKLIQAGERVGIRALKEVAGIKSGALRATAIHYMLIPRINAAGRVADASDVVKLLLTNSHREASHLAEWLNGLNLQRQQIGESVHSEAMEALRSSGALENGAGAIVVAGKGWHRGVLGIVAARITGAFYRPAFVLSIDNGLAKGSARSIPPFDVHDGLSRCKELLKSFGGHKQAAGLTLSVPDIDLFRKMISGIVHDRVPESGLVPVLRIDAPLRLAEVTMLLVQQIAQLEPFGFGNEEPIFGARQLEVTQPRIVGNNHLKMYLRQNGKGMDTIGFDLGGMLDNARNGDLIDAAFLPVLNEWDGGKYLQLNLKALRESIDSI